jgi:DNA-binding LytR/AlgR family response regulator
MTMDNAEKKPLAHRRLLVVEDEYMVACEVAEALEDAGANIIGPAATIEDALRLIEEHGDAIDGAVLDVNLRDELVYPVADALMARGVPTVFATGYDQINIPDTYAAIPRCLKPVLMGQLIRLLSA